MVLPPHKKSFFSTTKKTPGFYFKPHPVGKREIVELLVSGLGFDPEPEAVQLPS
jgi:hypothetical protein